MALVVSKDQIQDYIGKETGVSDWFRIDQDRINRFADVTLDHQYIHVDPERAAKTPFGSTIAHGFLTLSMVPHLAENAAIALEGAVMLVNYGSDKVRFMNPVKVNSDIRARSRLISVDEKPGNRFLFKSELTIEIKGEDRPALVAEWLTLQVLGA